MRYSVDTSTYTNAWQRHYPIDHFPSLWERIEALIEDASIRSTMEVKVELNRQADDLAAWLKARHLVFVEINDDVQQAVREILRRFPQLIDARKNRSGADPFVIGLAMVERCAVVSAENPTGSIDRPHIPDVCAALDVRHLSLLDVIREENWVFA